MKVLSFNIDIIGKPKGNIKSSAITYYFNLGKDYVEWDFVRVGGLNMVIE